MLGMNGGQIFCLLIFALCVLGAVLVAWAPSGRRKGESE